MRPQVSSGRVLEAIGLLGRGDGGTDACPLCLSNLATPVPSVTDLRTSLERLQRDMAGIGSRRPRVDEIIVRIEDETAEVRRLMVDIRTQLEAAQAAASATGNAEENRRRDYVRGASACFSITSLLLPLPRVERDAFRNSLRKFRASKSSLPTNPSGLNWTLF